MDDDTVSNFYTAPFKMPPVEICFKLPLTINFFR